jgi:hypothetical protein
MDISCREHSFRLFGRLLPITDLDPVLAPQTGADTARRTWRPVQAFLSTLKNDREALRDRTIYERHPPEFSAGRGGGRHQ